MASQPKRALGSAQIVYVVLLAVISVQAQTVQQAQCTLVLKGDSRFNSSATASAGVQPRVSEARLSCNSTKPITVGVDSRLLQQHAANFKGVSVVDDLDCMRNNTISNVPLNALLYFCDNYSLDLRQANVQGLWLQNISDDGNTYYAAAIAFGGGVHATVTGGSFVGNSLGMTVAVLDRAVVAIRNANISSNDGTMVGGVLAAANSTVAVSNCTFSSNDAGALRELDAAALTVVNSNFSNNTARKAAGVFAESHSSTVIKQCTFGYNTATGAAGAVLASGNAQVVINGSEFQANAATVGGAIAADTAAAVNVTHGTFHNNTASFGAAIQLNDDSSLLLVSSTLESNVAETNGGGLNANSSSSALITSSVFSNNTAGTNGGGLIIWCTTPTSVSIINSSFVGNQASNGAGLSLWQNSSVTCTGLVVQNNSASEGGGIAVYEYAQIRINNTEVVANTASDYGGGLFANGTNTITITSSRFHGNNATWGGGLRVDGASRLEIASSSFEVNTASSNGGGLNVYDNVNVSVSESRFVNNQAGDKGGGMVLWNLMPAPISVTDSIIEFNQASNGAGSSAQVNSNVTFVRVAVYKNSAAYRGGGLEVGGASQVISVDCNVSQNSGTSAAGIHSLDNSSVSMHRCIIADNVADDFNGGYGGGFWASGSSLVFFNNSQIAANLALYGGGVFADSNSNVTLLSSSVDQNKASFGGGIRVENSCQLTVLGSSLDGNTANTHGGGLNVAGNVSAMIAGSTFMNNNAYNRGGGLVIWNDYPRPVSIRNSTFNTNNASNGGGLSIVSNSSTVCSNLVVFNNSASDYGGGVEVADSAQAIVQGCEITENEASNGGGIQATNAARLILTDGSWVHRNSARQGGGVYLEAGTLQVSNNSSITLNSAKWGGGFFAASDGFSLQELQASMFNNSAEHEPDISTITTALSLMSNSTIKGFVSKVGSTSDQGFLVVLLNTSGIYGLPCGGVSVSAQMDGVTLATSVSNSSGIVQMFLRMHKPPGQYEIVFNVPEDMTIPEALMSLEVRSCIQGEVSPSTDTCQECLPGMYSLDPTKPVCDACPQDAVCPGGAAILPVLGSWHSAAASAQIHRCPNTDACYGNRSALLACLQDAACLTTNYTNMQCGAGYQGNVCGICREGSGTTKPFHCRTCMKTSSILALYVVGAVVMLGFIKLLCHFTLTENCADPSPGASVGALSAFSSSCDAAEAAMVSGTANPPKQPPTEMLRCLVLYSQRMLLVASLNVDWPASVAYPMRALAWFWSTSSPETLSIDCVLPHSSMPMAAQRVVFYLSMPLAALLALVVIEACTRSLPTRRRTAHVSVWNRFASNAMVVVFFFLPAVLRMVFGLFACIPLDKPVPPPYAAKAVGSFWVYDVNTNCFAGYHKALSLGLGIPLLLLLCIGMPLVIVFLAVSNRDQLHDKVFRQHYGFLTKSYSPNRCWWEAVVVCETIVLVAISVFGVNTGPFYQCLLMALVLALMGHLHLVLCPYAYRSTGRAMRQSINCLFYTSLVGLSFLAYGPIQPSAAYGIVMGVVLLVVNVAFVGSVLWQLVQLVDWRRVGHLVRRTTAVAVAHIGCGTSMGGTRQHTPWTHAGARNKTFESADHPRSIPVGHTHGKEASIMMVIAGNEAGTPHTPQERSQAFSDLDRVFSRH